MSLKMWLHYVTLSDYAKDIYNKLVDKNKRIAELEGYGKLVCDTQVQSLGVLLHMLEGVCQDR